MFEAIELPAGIADLNPCLADVDGKALSHDEWYLILKEKNVGHDFLWL